LKSIGKSHIGAHRLEAYGTPSRVADF
jgi:hypothetical protein